MQTRDVRSRPRPLRGRAFTPEEFQYKYGLDTDEARALFDRFGPSSVELDLLMSAKGRRPVSSGNMQ